MEIPFRNDDWGLAVDLNTLIKDASEAQLWLSANLKDNRESQLKSKLRKLRYQMTQVETHFERLKIDEE